MGVWTVRIFLLGLVGWIGWTIWTGPLRRPSPLPVWAEMLYMFSWIILGTFVFWSRSTTPYTARMLPWGRPAPVKWHDERTFTFDPVGVNRDSATMTAGRISAVWWEPAPREHAAAHLDFEIPDHAPADIVKAALRHALDQAEDEVPGRGKVRIRVTHRDAEGPTSYLHVRIDVKAHGAKAEWAHQAGERFTEAFLARLAKNGIQAAPRER